MIRQIERNTVTWFHRYQYLQESLDHPMLLIRLNGVAPERAFAKEGSRLEYSVSTMIHARTRFITFCVN